jgi:type VII secretion protein EccE
MDRLVRAVAESNQPGIGLQLLVHTIPAPSVVVNARHRCTTSYRELLEAHGPVPATQTTWVVVRLDARTLAEATIGGLDSSAQAPTAVAALARRVGKTLGRAGFAHQVLDADGVVDALARSCDLERPLDNPSVTPAPRESWASWHSVRFAHATFWLRRWPADPAGVRPLIGRLITAPAAATNVSLTIELHDGRTDVRCLVRIAAVPAELAAACRSLVQIAERSDGGLFPLDGEQAPAVYASAPTGGGMG